MAPKALPQIKGKPMLKGTDDYEKKRAEIVQALNEAIPEEYHLDKSLVEKPPLDVTQIPRSCGILTPTDLEITEDHDATSLLKAIASRKYTSVQVATAFCKRAAIAHQLTSCLTDFFQDEALERAQYLDKHLEEHGKPIGPLHGLPISIKAHMAITERYSDWGSLYSLKKIEHDSLTAKILREAGAVFYVKTNQPQSIMHLETDSFWGRTLNPYNINLSSGGSSGGEAALNALRGSVMGVGSDIGGSIRGPAGFCNIHGFKPQGFTTGGFAAELNVLATGGPMCRTLRDADLYMRVMRSANLHLHDPSIIRTPWTGLATELSKPLKIGIMKHDGAITPHPPVTRTLNWATSTIKSSPLASQFTLKPFSSYKAAHGQELLHSKLYFPETPSHLRAEFTATGEPELPLTTWAFRKAPQQELNATEIAEQRWQRDRFRREFLAHWNAQDVDFVLCPVFVGAASMHDTAKYWNYTSLWNLVDYPGMVIPTPIRVKDKAEEDKYPEDWEAMSEEDKDVRRMWEEGGFEGAPIGLQVVARKWFDNELMAAVGMLEEALGYRPLPGEDEVPVLDWNKLQRGLCT
ncbi:putative amidase [Cyphellophora attinorum]|uniref:Putative amidase n=1 Tax=Cyphellophora attinorum TaxID=1664694 RepID=A0A0N1H9I7_9EURO|nr:putative amidase [Phialophora attinorum]KPI38833.1 putative amidase [Phialophora attinorum]